MVRCNDGYPSMYTISNILIYYNYTICNYYIGTILLTFAGLGIVIVLATVMILIGITLGLVHKRKRKLHLQSPIDSSNIYSHTNNYIQQRYDKFIIIHVIIINFA